MISIIQLRSSAWRQYAAILILFLLLSSVVIGKALLLDNCMGFDASDDLNHTFTGLSIAKKLITDGAMPYFDFYNNFGTPLMGDALTYPFAIQAIPYYFTDFINYPLVLTVNRFVLCFATLTSLFVFYRTFNISIFSSAIAGICVFFNFGFYWHFAHHHYQSTLLFAVTILIFQRVSIIKNNYKSLFFSVAIISALMIYSVSANLILLGFVSFLLHPLFYKKSPKAFIVNAAALLSGLILGSIEIITTLLAMSNSVRSGKSYADGFFIHFSSYELILRELFQFESDGVHIGHVYHVTYFPMFVLLAYIVGMYLYFKDKNNNTLALSLVLGLLPMLVTGALLVNTGIWKVIPLLRSTDITRVTWIAMIFVGLGIGNFTDAILGRTINKQISWVMLIVMTVASCLCTIFVATGRSPALYALGYWTAWTLMVLYLLQNYLERPLNDSAICKYVLNKWSLISGVIILISMISAYCPIVYHLGNWDNPGKCRSYNYFTEVPAFDPKLGQKVGRLSETARFALESNSDRGLELISETFARHGGGGRSIALDDHLRNILLCGGLIENDNLLCGYHFTNPWDTGIANRLGLRYFGTPNAGIHDNWKLFDRWDNLFIYENDQKPSIIYFLDENNIIKFIESFKIKGNDILVDIPKTINGGRLYVTITARPGFSVYVDGVKRVFGVDNFGFIYVDITPANKMLTVSYNPLDYNWLFEK